MGGQTSQRPSVRISRRQLLQYGAALSVIGHFDLASAGALVVGDTGWIPGVRRLTNLGQSVIFKIPAAFKLHAQGDNRYITWGNPGTQNGSGPELTMYVDSNDVVQLQFLSYLRAEIKAAPAVIVSFLPNLSGDQDGPISAQIGLGNNYALGCKQDGPQSYTVRVTTTNSLQYPVRKFFDDVTAIRIRWAANDSTKDCNDR